MEHSQHSHGHGAAAGHDGHGGHEAHFVPFEPQVPVDLPVQRAPRTPGGGARLTVRFCGGTTFSRRTDGTVMAFQPKSTYMPHVSSLLWLGGTWAAAPKAGALPGEYHPWLPSMHPGLTAPPAQYAFLCLGGHRLAVGGGGRVLKTAQRLLPLRRLLTGTLRASLDEVLESAVHLTDGELRDGAPVRTTPASHWWRATNGAGPLMLSDVTEYVVEDPDAVTVRVTQGSATSDHRVAAGEDVTLYLFHMPTMLGGHGRPSNVAYHHRQAGVLFDPPVPPASIPLLEAPTLLAETPTGPGMPAPCVATADVKGLSIPPDSEFCLNAEF